MSTCQKQLYQSKVREKQPITKVNRISDPKMMLKPNFIYSERQRALHVENVIHCWRVRVHTHGRYSCLPIMHSNDFNVKLQAVSNKHCQQIYDNENA